MLSWPGRPRLISRTRPLAVPLCRQVFVRPVRSAASTTGGMDESAATSHDCGNVFEDPRESDSGGDHMGCWTGERSAPLRPPLDRSPALTQSHPRETTSLFADKRGTVLTHRSHSASDHLFLRLGL